MFHIPLSALPENSLSLFFGNQNQPVLALVASGAGDGQMEGCVRAHPPVLEPAPCQARVGHPRIQLPGPARQYRADCLPAG